MSTAEFCRRVGIGKTAWSNIESADNRIGVDSAMLVRKVTGASLDWIFVGEGTIPHALAIEISKLEKADSHKTLKRA